MVSPKMYDLLKGVVSGNIEDYSISVHAPNKKGEGFLGEICFVSLKDKNCGTSFDLIVKQAFSDKSVRETHPIRKFYLYEIHFYTKVWPCFQKFQIDMSLTKPFNKVPKCFTTSTENEHENLVLENLKFQNFQTHDKRRPFDEEHIKYIFKEYGKFHAISFAHKLLKPQEYQELTKGLEDLFLLISKNTVFYSYFKYVYEISLNSLDPEKDAKVIEKFKPYAENIKEIYWKKSDYHGDHSVLLHGDCWSNNMMFKYDESKQLCDMRLLDFQCIKIGTPVYDLAYCLYSGASKKILDQLDHYLRIYHCSLSETLEAFGLDSENIFPLEALKKDWKEYCIPGLTMGLTIWRGKLTYEDEVKDLTDMKDMQDASAFQESGFDVDAFKSLSRDLILHMFENDFL